MQQFPVLLFIIHRTSSNESPSLITAEATIAAYHCRIVVADDATMKSSSYRVRRRIVVVKMWSTLIHC